MKAVKKIRNLPDNVKFRFRAALLLMCMVMTFIVPVFGGGYSMLKTETITSSASVNDVDLLLVGSSAFGEARKVMNASSPDAREQFIKNVEALLHTSWSRGKSNKWQNLGLLLGPKDALSGSTWNVYQNPTTLSLTEVQNYGSDVLTDAYKKYKAFGYAVEDLNIRGKKSESSAVSVTDSLDSMSAAALKLGNFGVKFLNDYNPAPVVLSLYDSSNLSTYADNKLVKIVSNNQIMKQIICLFGDKVGNTGLSFFILINAVLAIALFALSMLLSLLGNQSIGDGVRKLLIRVVIGTVGIYLIGNLMSVMLKHVTDTVLNVEASESISYIENNLNIYDWYLTGFSLPSDIPDLTIDKSGQFRLNKETIKKINKYTYKRLTGNSGSADAIRKRMEDYTKNENKVIASFVTPTYKSISDENGEGESWATDKYYKIMDNFAANKDLGEGLDGIGFSLYASRYLWMSSLTMEESNGVWKVSGSSNDNYYGLNPISAFNLLRTEFSGDNITATAGVYPTIPYVFYDAVNVRDTSSEGSNMNSILRFIAIFTIIMAALKGMITIFTAGFGGILSGGIKTATGSSYGLGQALGGVVAIFGGLIGISLILSVTMTLLDAVYGIAYELLNGSEIISSILAPIEDAVGDIPLIGDLIMNACEGMVSLIMTLIFSLTFPKLGGIPINVFCQYMADIPGKIAERAQMIEGMLLSGRTSAGGGGLGRPGGGRHGGYGQMAAAQASQAFGSAQRQAVGVVAGVAGAAASLAGMGLSAAGKALNKKADGVEGKPDNPGLDNWDDLSPEQQSAAAAAAADMGEDWDKMDQDARQKAMEDRMEAEEANAQEASQADGQSDGEQADGESASVSGEGLDDADDGVEVNGLADDMGDASVADAGESSSVSENELDGQPSGAEGGDIPDADGATLNGDSEGDTVSNFNNEHESLNAEQNIGNNIMANSEDKSVDNSNLTEEGDNDLDGSGTDKNGNPVPAPGSSMNDSGIPGKDVGDKKAESVSANVQNNQTANMKNSQTSNMRAQQIDKSRSSTMNKTRDQKTASTPGQSPGQNQTAQGLNGTSRSTWGKEMTVKEQRKARIMHAVGDGLQMAGGNRTVGDGLRDAMGHMKDAAVSYTISDDVLPTISGSIRERRRARERRNRQNRG